VGYAHVDKLRLDRRCGGPPNANLVEALPESGVAVLNADDSRVAKFAAAFLDVSLRTASRKTPLFEPRMCATHRTALRFRTGGVELESKLAGRHGVSNLLAGVAVASIYGIGPNGCGRPRAPLNPGP